MRTRFNISRKRNPARALSIAFAPITMICLFACAARSADAAFLSEIWLESTPVRTAGDGSLQPVGPLIEIAGLGPSQQLEIMILDATAGSANRGRILQVIPFTTARDIHVITGSQGDNQPASADTVAESITTADSKIDALAFMNVLGEVGRRSVLLLDRWTGLTPLDGRIQDLADSPLHDGVVDVVTFGDLGRTQPLGLEAVLDPASGSVLVRPFTPLLEPSDHWLAGPVDRLGRLIGDAKGFPTSPGHGNAVLMPGQIPEPASLCLWSGLLATTTLPRRGRRETGRSKGPKGRKSRTHDRMT